MMLLGCALGALPMGCLLPQDDQLITELPLVANRPLRVIPGLSQPPQRESTVRTNPACRTTFSVQVDDQDLTDEISARWFIDPDERYVATTNKPSVEGNIGVIVGAGSTVRLVQSNSQFSTQLGAFGDGRQHRVEVVVTDGRFQENQSLDRDNNPQPFLDVSRASVRTSTGEVVPVQAYRDDFVWLVTVLEGCP